VFACFGGKPNVTDWAFHRGERRDRRLWDDPGELDGSNGRMGQVVPRLGTAMSSSVREVFERSDVPPDAQKAADNPTVRAQIEQRIGS